MRLRKHSQLHLLLRSQRKCSAELQPETVKDRYLNRLEPTHIGIGHRPKRDQERLLARGLRNQDQPLRLESSLLRPV